MPWSVAAPIIGAVASSAISSGMGSSSKNGGAGTTTVDKSPWLQAQPWITNNMNSGQALQAQYATQPFNAQQLAAYQNLGNQTNYMNALTPSLLGQISGQQVGFNRANPDAKPTAYNFNGAGNVTGNAVGMPGQSQGGLLGMLSSPAPSATSAANPPAPAPAPVSQPKFVNQTAGVDSNTAYKMSLLGAPAQTGSYGSFTYGDRPTPGTPQWNDMQQYIAYGGADPQNLYGGGNGNAFNLQAYNNSVLTPGMYAGNAA